MASGLNKKERLPACLTEAAQLLYSLLEVEKACAIREAAGVSATRGAVRVSATRGGGKSLC